MPTERPVGYASVIHGLRLVGDAERMAITYAVGSAITGAEAQQVTNDLHAAFGTHLAPRISNQYSLVETELSLQTVAQPADPQVYLASNVIA